MKNINVLLCAVVLFVAMTFREADGRKMTMEEIRKAVKGLKKTCMPKTGVPKEMVDAVSLSGEFADDKRFQCYQKCVLSLMKAMKGDDLRESVMISQADMMLFDEDAARVKAAISACVGEVKSTDGCERAWEFTRCYYGKDKEVYFLP